MINQATPTRNLEEIIPGLDPVPEDEELFEDDDELIENDEELFKVIMMINQATPARNLEEIIPSLDPIPENDELLGNDEELFIEEQEDKNKIPEELSKEYFKAINFSILPF